MVRLATLQKEYNKYKESFAKNLVFDDISNDATTSNVNKINYQPLQVVHIYFNTATYDKIKKDVKVTLEAQLGVIGGTMGLFAGFSIFSGVEIIYFVLKFLVKVIFKKKKSH